MKHYPNESNYKYNEHYFTAGEIYDKYAHCESQDIFRRQVEMIKDIIGSFKGKTILDVGGALGWFAKRCQDVGATSFCQEISEWACQNSPIQEQMRCGDIGKGILFKDSMFDIVTAIEMLEHIPDVKNALKEVSRVLKPDGLFYCSVGISTVVSHVWIGTVKEWEELINNTPGLRFDKNFTTKIRNHPYCKEQNWNSIIARRI